MVKRAEHSYGKERVVLFENREEEEKEIDQIYETEWSSREDENVNQTTILQRVKRDGSDEKYLKDRPKEIIGIREISTGSQCEAIL